MWWLVGELESIRRFGNGWRCTRRHIYPQLHVVAVLLERWFYFTAVAPRAAKKPSL